MVNPLDDMPPVTRSPRLDHSCPVCGAGIGERCIDRRIDGCHEMRGEEFAALCPTCGGLPTDYHEMTKLRAALTEALDQWERFEDPRNGEFLRIAELRKEHGL
jgi:hypothetical protein